MTDPILYFSIILSLGGIYTLISSFDDDDDGDDDGDGVRFQLNTSTSYKLN